MELLTIPREVLRRTREIYHLWLTPDGGQLVVLLGDEDGPSRLVRYGLPGWQLLGRMSVVIDYEHGIADPPPEFSADCRLMTVGNAVCRAGRRRPFARLVDYPERRSSADELFTNLRFGPAGRVVYGTPAGIPEGVAGTVLCWDLAAAVVRGERDVFPTREREITLRGRHPAVEFDLSPDGSLLVANLSHLALCRWNLRAGAELPKVNLPAGAGRDPSGGRSLRFSPDGRTLAARGLAGWHLLNAASGELRATLPAPVADLAFTPDGRRLLAVAGREATFYDSATGAVVELFDFQKHAGPLSCVAVAPDGLTAVAAGTRGRLVRWDLPG